MVKLRYIEKHRDKNGIIKEYIVQYENCNMKAMKPKQLKHLIIDNKVIKDK